MEQKGQYIQCQSEVGEIALAMPKVVFHMVAFGLQDVDVLIFRFPARASRLRQPFHRAGLHRPIGDPGIVIERFSRLLVYIRQFQPVDLECPFCTQRHLVDKAIAPDFPIAAVQRRFSNCSAPPFASRNASV